VLVLHGHHRGQVVHGQVARVLDGDAEGLLRGERGGGSGHAGFQQHGFEVRFERPHLRARAAQHEGQQAEGAAGVVRMRQQVVRQPALAVGEGDDARQAGTRGLRDQPFQFAMQWPARAQQFHRVVGGGEQAQVEVGRARVEARQVVGDAGGQRLGRGLVQHQAPGDGAGFELQREGAVQATDRIHVPPYAPVWKSRATPLSYGGAVCQRPPPRFPRTVQ